MNFSDADLIVIGLMVPILILSFICFFTRDETPYDPYLKFQPKKSRKTHKIAH